MSWWGWGGGRMRGGWSVVARRQAMAGSILDVDCRLRTTRQLSRPALIRRWHWRGTRFSVRVRRKICGHHLECAASLKASICLVSVHRLYTILHAFFFLRTIPFHHSQLPCFLNAATQLYIYHTDLQSLTCANIRHWTDLGSKPTVIKNGAPRRQCQEIAEKK